METRWGDKPEPKPFQRKALTPDDTKDLALWYDCAKRWIKQGKSAVDWENKHLGEDIAAPIRLKLASAQTELDVVKAFELGDTQTDAPDYKSDLAMLADAINKSANGTKAKPGDMHFDIQLPNISLSTQMPQHGAVTVTVPELPAPTVIVEQKANEPDESKDVVKAIRKLAGGK